MQDRILQVFYGNDRLPYKDKDRSIHYPITGNTFLGSSNVDKIRFYVRDIGGTNNITWVLNAKLPNGSILYQVLSTIGLDSDLGEYYVEFSVSQFYTQLIGDIYFALNGCDGNVSIETDSETNIQTITATIESQTILTTGVIKFSNNYAPQRPVGFSFDLDQYQTIINALSDKSNVSNTIQVVADISNEDLSGYENGQLFYDILTKRFYKKASGSATDYNFVANNQTSVSVIINPTTNINGRVFVHFTSSLETISGYQVYKIKYDGQNTTEEQAREYMLYMTGSSYLPKYNYDRPANTYFLTPEGQLLKPQYDDSNGLLLIIMPKLALESYVINNYVPYSGANKDVNLGTHTIVANNLYKGSKTSNNELTTKSYVDDLVSTIKANAFILVDTTTYPTLNDFLASQGEEGYIYLYPSTNQQQGYYQYIWESNGWLDIGTTQIDLSNYYTKSETNSLLNGKLDKKTTSGSYVYGHENSTQTEYAISYYADANTVARRGDNGTLLVGTPTNYNHATPKSYVDNLILQLANAKVSKTNSANKVYGTDDTGAQATFGYDDYVDGDFVRRDANGRIYAQNPIANGQVATKQYVDNGIAGAISNVYKIKGSKTVAELNALTGQEIGDVYNLLDSGTLNAGNIQVFTGDNVVWLGSAWDKLGTEIDWSAYDEKFMSAGFFEVQNYNESTGEITMVYATELYDMNYNGDTGILSIEAN